jgi:hypothetical protein
MEKRNNPALACLSGVALAGVAFNGGSFINWLPPAQAD